MSSVQLHLYNAATIDLAEEVEQTWAEELSTRDREVKSYVISLNFDQIENPGRRHYFNNIPTSFALEDEQVDALIEMGGELLRNHPVYRELLADIEAGR